MAVVNTNFNALFSQTALAKSGKAQSIAMRELSTGLRINSAKDDAAGMSISTRMTEQIRGLNQAIRNAGDAINLIQTAEGATNEITDMLQRMRELAVQAANDTNNNADRSYLDLEFQQIKQQIVQITDSTEWNGFPVLSGKAGESVGEMPVYKVTSENQFGSVFIDPTTTRSISGAGAGEIQTFKLAGTTPTLGTISIAGVDVQITSSENTLAAAVAKIKTTLNNSQAFKVRGMSITEDAHTAGKMYLNYSAADGDVPVASVLVGSTSMTSTAVSVDRTAATKSVEVFENNGKFLQSGSLQFDIASGATIGSTVTAAFTNSDHTRSYLSGTLVTQNPAVVKFTATTLQNSSLISGDLTYTLQDAEGANLNLTAKPRAISMSIGVQGSIPALREGDLVINGVNISTSSADDDTLSPRNNSAGSAIAKAAAINRKAVDQGVSQGEAQSITFSGVPSPGTIIVGGVSVVITSEDSTPPQVVAKVASAMLASPLYNETTGRRISYANGSSVINVEFPSKEGNVDKLEVVPGATGVGSVVNTTRQFLTKTAGTGVFAKVNENLLTGQAMLGGPVVSGVVFINGFASADITTVYNNSQATRSNVVHAINLVSDRTGVKAIDTGSDVKGISLVAVDGRNIEVRFETAASTHSNVFGQRIGMREGVQSATISLESNIETSIVLSSDPLGDISRSGLVDGDFSKNESVQMTSQRTQVKPSVKQIETVHFSGPLPSEGDIFGVTINGVGFTYRANASDGLSFQSLRNNLINQINAKGGLNVAAVKGQNTSEIHLVSDTPGVSFSLSMQSRSEVMMSSSTLVENHRADTRSLGMDDLIINGVKVPPTNARSDKVSTYRSSSSEPSASAIAIADSINSVKQITGVSAFPNGAEISGQYTDTSLPSAVTNSLYSLFINGIEVKIPFSQNESVSQRLSNVVTAINMREGQHGVVASSNGKGVDLLSDGRNISVWYDSNVKDLSPACFGLEQGGSVSQISQITITGPSDVTSVVQTPTYIEFSDFGTVTEQLGISVDGSPSSANGVFSFFNGVLYKGDGVRANGIGRIDATNNGVNGLPLRINLSNILNSSYQFTYNDHYYEFLYAATSWTSAKTNADNSQLFGLNGYLLNITDEQEQLFIKNKINSLPTLDVNQTVGWWLGAKKENAWSWVGGPEKDNALNYYSWSTGEPTNGLNEKYAMLWASGTGNENNWEPGKWNDTPLTTQNNLIIEYGGIGTLTQPTISAQELQALKSKITYSDTASNQNTVSVAINGVTVTSSQTTRSALALASSLEQAIQEKISDGILNNISVERLDDKITIKSTVAGAGFDIYGADSTSNDNSLSIQEVQSNDQGNNLVTAVHGANGNSEGAATAYGTVSLVAQPTQLSSLLHADGISAQSGGLSGKAIQISCGANGFGAESNFKALGFREGTFGGMASADLQPPRIGRMAFQIGSDSGQHITIDLPDFGSKGGITGEITNDVAMEVENRSIRITTREGAVTVLGLLDSVMDKVNSNRANYGAVINRLEHVINNLSSGSVNMTASRSQIQDADYAASSTEMAKTTIMQQAATAVLAQANASNQNVLKLLES